PGVEVGLYVDDTVIYASNRHRKNLACAVQRAVTTLGEWFRTWRIAINPVKSAAIMFEPHTCKLPRTVGPLSLFGRNIPWATKTKYLGVTLDSKLNFNAHVTIVRNRAVWILSRLRPLLSSVSKMSLRHKLTLYKMCVRPILTYSCAAFAHMSKHNFARMQRV
ncbi:reverse transcriptase domain-containing protein, partial [Escherichia coli]|uniref:reverse transcriptase domain-containing protein n=1 Tax=Escherichia coli TaxID=562 RepID=UPI003B429EAC